MPKKSNPDKKKYKERSVINYEIIYNSLLKLKKDSLFFDVIPSIISVLKSLDIVDDMDNIIRKMPLWFINRIKYLSNDKDTIDDSNDILTQITNYISSPTINPKYDEKGFFIDIENMIISDIYEEDFNFKKIYEISCLIKNQKIYDIFIDYYITEVMKYAKPKEVKEILGKLTPKVLIDIIEDSDEVNLYLKKHEITIE